MKKIILLILTTLFLVSGCTEELTQEQLKTELIKANSDIKTYTADVVLDMDMTVEILGQTSTVKTISSPELKVDMPNQKMSMIGKTTTTVGDTKTELVTETYLIGKEIFIKSMDSWIKAEGSETIWNEQDQLAYTIELLESGTIEILEDEKIGGESYYVVKLSPDLKKVAEIAVKQFADENMFGLEMDLGDMIKSYSSKIWVTKDSFVIEKVSTSMDMDLSDEGVFDITSNSIFSITSVNEPVVINLPEEAIGATDLSEMQDHFLEGEIDDEEIKAIVEDSDKYSLQEDFCGESTSTSCNTDQDCIVAGCSGQICQSKKEEPMMTTCEYRDCYDAESYGYSCGCDDNKCRWV